MLLPISILGVATLDCLSPDDGGSQRDLPVGSLALYSVEFAIVPSRVGVGEPVTFYANASSDVGLIINFTIRYDNKLPDDSTNPLSPVSIDVTGSPGQVVTTFTYDHEGNLTSPLTEDPFFEVALTVYDGYTTRTEKRLVYVVGNTAPVFVKSLAFSYEPTIGVEYEYSVKLLDMDDDPLNVTWDFGDGTPVVYDETGPAGTEVIVNQTHIWDPYIEPGTGDYTFEFLFNVTVDDGQGHVIGSTSEIEIDIDANLGPSGTFAASATRVDPSVEVWFYGSASDREGEAIIWTFVFEKEGQEYDTDVRMTDVTAPNEVVWTNISRVFSTEGNYSVTLHLTDAQLPELQVDRHNLTVGTVNITSKVNKLPYVMTTILVSPTPLRINSTNPTVVARLYSEVADADGDVLTATWDFDDGTESAFNVTPGGKQVYGISQDHEFSVAGYYNITLTVTDGWFNHTVVRRTVVTIGSENEAPTIVELHMMHTNGSYSLPGSVVGFFIRLHDEERDPIEIMWDFGDNSTVLRLNLTDFDDMGNVSCEVNHTYELRGEYRARITFTDNMFDSEFHNDSVNLTVRIRFYEIAEIQVWDIWDYVGLGVLSSMIGSVLAWVVFVKRKHRKIDQKGMTWDEFRIRKKEIRLGDLEGEGPLDPGGGGA